MSKIDRYKKNKENREAFKDIRRKANQKAEAERIAIALAKKEKSEFPDIKDE